MRVVQVAELLRPAFGGLGLPSTAWEPSTRRPGTMFISWSRSARPTQRSCRPGSRRISLPARLIPFTGGYRAVLPGPVTTLLERLEPDAIGGIGPADPPVAGPVGQATRRGHRDDLARAASTGLWDNCFHDASPAPSPTWRTEEPRPIMTRWSARRRSPGWSSTASPPQRGDGAPWRRPGTVPPAAPTPSTSDAMGAALGSPLGALWQAFGREARPSGVSMPLPHFVHSGVDARLVIVGEGPLRTRLERQAARLTGRLHRIRRMPRHRGRPSWHRPMSRWLRVRTRPSGWRRWKHWPAVHRRSCRTRRHWPRSSPGQRGARPTTIRGDRPRGGLDHRPAGTPRRRHSARLRAEALPVAQIGRGNAQRVGRASSVATRLAALSCPMGDAPVGPDDTERATTLWFALLLTLTNGFMDAHTYYVRGGVFANVQTGNVIFFAIDASERKLPAAMAHVWPILAFIVGVAVGRPHQVRPRRRVVTYPLRWTMAVRHSSSG